MAGLEVGRSSLLDAQRTISPLLAEPDPPEVLLPRLIERVCETLDWSLGALWRPVAGAARMRCGATWHRPKPLLERVVRDLRRTPVAPGEGPLGRVWLAGTAVWVPKADAIVQPALAREAGLQGLFAMPVTHAERTEGLLAFGSESRADPDPELVAALDLVAGQLAHYLDHWRQHRALLASQQQAEQVVDALDAGVLVMDAEGVVTSCNGPAARLMDVDPVGVLGRRLPLPEADVLLHSDGTPIKAEDNPIAHVLRTGEARRHTPMWFLRRGRSVWIEMSVQPLPAIPGERTGGVVCSLLDVTERRQAEIAIRRSEARKGAMLEGAPDCVITTDGNGHVLEFNPAAEETLGYTRHEAIGRPLAELIVPPARRADLVADLEDFRKERSSSIVGRRVELTAVRKDGREFRAEISITCVDAEGEFLFTAFLRDISERAETERELRDARDRAERYLDMAGSIIVALDRDLRVTMINRAGLELLGYEDGELIAARWIETVVPLQARGEAQRVLGSMLEGVAPRDLDAKYAEAPLLTKSGDVRTMEWRTSVFKDPDGALSGLLCSGTDVTDRIRSEQAVAHLAYHDQLTGLPNRALLEEHLEVALARAEREGRELALLFLDLDNFKLVNDSLGHAAGDRLLQLVTERLTAITRASDLLARQGGDELLLLLTDLEGGTTVEIAESVAEKILKALAEPFQVGEAEFEIGASVGVAVFPHDGRSAAALLRTADATMYQAKAAGRNRVALHRPGLGLEGAGELISATTRLRHALTADELTVHYQPILSVPAGSVDALEALVRWEDPRRGLVPAADFMQLAEETGLVESIGEWVIGAICRQAARWRERGIEARIHFNLSPRQLRQRHVIESIADAVGAAGLEPGFLTAEIGESAAMAESRGDSSVLQKLHDLGVHLAVDNFGAGNSSLGRLRDLPVEELKLHRLLLRGVPHDRNSNALARAVIELAGGLGMRAVAEGVENEDQWRFVVDHGCPLAQGFHLGHPAPAEEITRLLERAA